jgi:alpha-beta hydrolase superfamily lysophospholipase
VSGPPANRAEHELTAATGARDPAIPAWATRLFVRWSGLPRSTVQVVPGAGHLLFHDPLDVTVPLVADWLDARPAGVGPG